VTAELRGLMAVLPAQVQATRDGCVVVSKLPNFLTPGPSKLSVKSVSKKSVESVSFLTRRHFLIPEPLQIRQNSWTKVAQEGGYTVHYHNYAMERGCTRDATSASAEPEFLSSSISI
jgi:hypothetical protein